jgi:SPW repeat-containing protein
MKRVVGLNVVAGIWLVVSPLVLGIDDSAYLLVAVSLMTGVLLMTCSTCMLEGLVGPVVVSRVEAYCGLWLVLSPHVFNNPAISRATANDVVVGSLVIALCFVQML